MSKIIIVRRDQLRFVRHKATNLKYPYKFNISAVYILHIARAT